MDMRNKPLTEDNKIWLIETLLKSNSYEEFKEEADDYFKVTEKEVETKPVTIDIPREVVSMSTPSEEPSRVVEEKLPPMSEEDKKRASIYALEHRRIAMEENNIGSFNRSTSYEERVPVSTPVIEREEEVPVSITQEEPKTKVLEPNGRKVTYENIRVVLPGQLKL